MFLKRVISHILRLNRFKLARFVLPNGVFELSGKTFNKVRSFNLLFNYPIFSRFKYSYLVSSGSYHIGMYKTTIIGQDSTFYCYKNKSRYLKTKTIIKEFSKKIPYRLCEFFYLDKKKIMFSPTIKGYQFFDKNHYEKMINYLLESYERIDIFEKNIKFDKEIFQAPYCVQHGDCHLGNIFWVNEEPFFIDLDDMGSYPLFYDLFYFFIRYDKDNLNNTIHSKLLEERIKNVLHDCGLKSIDNPVDYFLSIFILHWVNDVDKNMSKHDVLFLFGWISKVNLKSFPTTQNVVKILNCKLNKLNFDLIKYDI